MEEHILFSKIQQGDAGAFEWLYKKYHPRMYVFCYGLLHDSDKAKDIAQECFVAFWEYRTASYADEHNILNDLYFEELNNKYLDALEKLPKQCQTIFRMNRNQGMRSDEIASVLKLSVRTVENQLYRGLKLIRQSLDDYLTILILLFVDNLFK